MNMYSVGSHTQ